MTEFIKYRGLLLGLASLLIMVLVSGCGGQVKPAEAPTDSKPALVKVRYAPYTGLNGLAARMGKDKGFFAEEGIDVELIEMKDSISGLASGDVDFADSPTTNAIIAAGRGAPVKIVASAFRTKGPFYLISKPEIKKIEDLRGKKIGISGFGTGLEVYTRVILQKHGLTPNDVTFIANGSHNQAFASLESGQVDATIIHEPFVTLGETTGKAHLLARGWDYLPTFHTGVLTASSQFINKQPELVEKMIRAYLKSQEYAKNHQDEYLDYAMKSVKIDRAVLADALKRESVLWENNPAVNADSLNDTQRIQLEQGFQEKIYDLSKILDVRFIPQK
ncbi:MAG: myristoyl transferase [Sporomusa sp.]|nr:myristoyl transferase [Sporomusa sp.]